MQAVECPVCKHAVSPDARACPGCGHPTGVAMKAVRKKVPALVAIAAICGLAYWYKTYRDHEILMSTGVYKGACILAVERPADVESEAFARMFFEVEREIPPRKRPYCLGRDFYVEQAKKYGIPHD